MGSAIALTLTLTFSFTLTLLTLSLAARQCFRPDKYLDKAIKSGNFDNIFVRFYNKPSCQYSPGNAASLITSWNAWNSYVSSSTSLFLELPAAPNGGYIPPSILTGEVLPYISKTSHHAGVALWDRSHDVITNYSTQIKDHISHPTKTLTDAVY